MNKSANRPFSYNKPGVNFQGRIRVSHSFISSICYYCIGYRQSLSYHKL